MKYSILSVVVSTIIYMSIALSAIYSPEIIYGDNSYNHVLVEAITPTPTPTAIPMPKLATQIAVASAANVAPASVVLNDAQITFLGNCESGMNPTTNTGNGYYGAFQFSYGTWKSMGTGYERADMAPLEVQKDAVQRLLSRSSIFTQFPGCAAKMRNLGLI